jgi:hypothetical protein
MILAAQCLQGEVVVTPTWRRWALWYSTVTAAVIGLLLATAEVNHDRKAWDAAELGTVLVAVGWAAWVVRWPQGAMLTLALVTAGAETIGVIAIYTEQPGEIAGFSYVGIAFGYGLTAIVLVLTATLGRVVWRRPRPSWGPWWLSVGLSVGWALSIAAGAFTIWGGLTAQQGRAVVAAIGLSCVVAGGYVGATRRWASLPLLLATAIPAVLVATAIPTVLVATATGNSVARDFPSELLFIVWFGLPLVGVVCFLFAVGAALGAGVASLVPRRSRAALARTVDQP